MSPGTLLPTQRFSAARLEYLDVTLPDLAANLALDEALLLQAEADAGPEMLRFWEWPGLAVVLGAGCRVSDDVNEAACRTEAVRLLRRSSGGGTVLLGPGCLLFSLILAYERSPFLNEVRPSYRYILGHVATALGSLAAGISVAGISDLAVAERKFSGNAQQRKRRYLLHHGTLLYDFAIDRVSRYLHAPARQPDYRGGRPHDAFLMNLPATAAQLKTLLRTAWDAQQAAGRWPEELVRRLMDEKYARLEWVRRR